MVLNLENISGNGYKKFQIITTLFPQIKVLFPQKKIKKIQNCDINIQIVAEMCLNHKIAIMFEGQKCGRGVQKPA